MKIGLVIAHPDDESMFFKPLLSHYKGKDMFLLCLSTGNADGLGSIRTKELEKAARLFGISDQHVHVVDDVLLQDGMKEIWDKSMVQKFVEEFAKKFKLQVIYTFDRFGVSSHPNHIAVHFGVVQVVKNLGIKGFSLESTNILRKYIGVLDIPISWVTQSDGEMYVSFDMMLSYQAMQAHYSQFVWFRKLFIFFSRYSFCNTFVPIK
jgi:N-acetylglucosaminylphosphatidylinositol deacetylase